MLMRQPATQQIRWFSSEKPDNEEGGGRKLPSGFEKLLKRSKRGNVDKKDEKEQKKEEEKAEQSEGEEPQQKQSKGAEEETPLKKFYDQFTGGNGGKPPYEAWAMGAMLGCLASYYLFWSQSPSKEITYMDFVHTYLAKNDVEMITLCEDKGNSTFKYRANIQTISGEQVHLVLP